MKTIIFPYGEQEIAHLKKADAKLKNVIEQVGAIQREMIPDFFTALLHSITGQQISSKAHATVWQRFSHAVGEITPENICKISNQTLRECGLSERKVNYIRFAAEEISQGKLNPLSFCQMEDEEIIKRLILLPGVGRWTAEMLLIFSFGRKNVLAYDDFGIRKGICIVYGLDKLSKPEFALYKEKFSPYATVAGFYFWHVANNA